MYSNRKTLASYKAHEHNKNQTKLENCPILRRGGETSWDKRSFKQTFQGT